MTEPNESNESNESNEHKTCPFRADPNDSENSNFYCDPDCALFVPPGKHVGDESTTDGDLDGTCTFQNIAVQMKRSAKALERLASKRFFGTTPGTF
jgi:hypothetical protein